MAENEKRPRGWNFKKGAKDTIDPQEASQRGKKGGKVGGLAQVPKGFADPDVQARAQISRKLDGVDDEQESTTQETEA